MTGEFERAVWARAHVIGADLLVLIFIAKGVDEDWGRWSGTIETIAHNCRISTDKANKCLKKLSKCNFIKIERSEEFANIWMVNPNFWIGGGQAK